jgi:hypothetical protein
MGGRPNQYYNLEDYNAWKRNRGLKYRALPWPNFLCAVDYVTGVLDGHGVTWAAVGGLSMLCLGQTRNMFDLQIIYNRREFRKLECVLESDRRYFASHLYAQRLLTDTA